MQITVQELDKQLKAGTKITLVDVREPDEFEICSLPNAVLIPLRQLPNHLDQLNAQDDIVLYCHHGMRSMHATLFLRQKGFSKALSLAGGIEAWSCEIDPAVDRY